jgi:phosphonate transport system substrate-binding protein
MFRLIKTLFLISIISLLVVGCKQRDTNNQIVFSKPEITPIESQDNKPTSPIRVAIISVLSPTDTITSYREIADYIGDKLDRPAILVQRKSYNEISNLIINGGADVALLTAGSYITYGRIDGIEAIALQQRMGTPYNYGYIVVHSQNEIDDIYDLKGKNIAFTDPISYSGYISVKYKLSILNETPGQFFGNYSFTYSQENSLKAVLNKVVDAAAVSALAYESVKRQNPEEAKNLKILSKSDPIGTGPVVISTNLSKEEKEIIKEGFMSMHENESMSMALQSLFIDRYLPFDPSLYEAPNEIVE